MKVMITGAAGQLGQALIRNVPDTINGKPVDLIVCSRDGGNAGVALDLADTFACRAMVDQFQPDWLINAAAYTAVDQAEEDSDQAYAVNAEAPAAFADAVGDLGIKMIQISTDFVFSGQQGRPYLPYDRTNPVSIYGKSKEYGEKMVLSRLADSKQCHVIRTSWLYGLSGKNFVNTMLRMHRNYAPQNKSIRVVADQVGSPTNTSDLAGFCWSVIVTRSHDHQEIPPLLHWSDAGVASWYDFSLAIADLAEHHKLISRQAEILPITSSQYPTSAERPHYSVLGGLSFPFGPQPEHWRRRLDRVLGTMACGFQLDLAS